MYQPKLYLKTLSEFAGALSAPYDADSVLNELAGRLTDLFRVADCGISLASGDRLEFATAYGREIGEIGEIERAQQQIQAGPCVMAFRTGEVIAIADLTDEADLWPEYCQAAARVGVIAVAAIPMRLSKHTVGALNLYDREPRTWAQEDLDVATVMAQMATLCLIHASHHRQQVELNQQLQTALDSRVVIEQAKGALGARHQITPAEAFERLRHHARSHNTTVRNVAEAVLGLDLDL